MPLILSAPVGSDQGKGRGYTESKAGGKRLASPAGRALVILAGKNMLTLCSLCSKTGFWC